MATCSANPTQNMPQQIRRFSLSKSACQIPPKTKSPDTVSDASSESLSSPSLIHPEVVDLNSQQNDEVISFRYAWHVKITKRLMSPSEPPAILQVSPAFCTAYNGVQFVWLMRMCDENCLMELAGEQRGQALAQRVNVTLYYKDGPSQDVCLESCKISVDNSHGERVFAGMPLQGLEYTKGSGGWSSIVMPNTGLESEKSPLNSAEFSQFIHENIGKHITISVQLRLHTRWFQPLKYLPSIDERGKSEACKNMCPVQRLCKQVLDEIRSNELVVPDVEFFDVETDKYALHRHVFLFGCKEVQQRLEVRCSGLKSEFVKDQLNDQIHTVFANVYFNEVISKEAECFEDFIAMLDASSTVHFPALKRECERYICREVMTESADLTFVKKTLLLAERFELPILKMVSCGVIVDRLLSTTVDENHTPAHSHSKIRGPSKSFSFPTKKDGSGSQLHKEQRSASSCSPKDEAEHAQVMTMAESMDEIREELMQIAEQFTTATDDSEDRLDELLEEEEELSDNDDSSTSDHTKHSHMEESESLVVSVIGQLEELAKHIRKVSMPPGVSPAPIFTNSIDQDDSPADSNEELSNYPPPIHSRARRSSLKTPRELLVHSSPTRPHHSGSDFFAQIASSSSLTNTENSQNGSNSNRSPKSSKKIPRRRSVMFSLPSVTKKYKNQEFKKDSCTSSEESDDDESVEKQEEIVDSEDLTKIQINVSISDMDPQVKQQNNTPILSTRNNSDLRTCSGSCLEELNERTTLRKFSNGHMPQV
ncbi:hypothetical protein DdX_06502 [Ditylenchus destructor]|uniref:Uncharacterized protein n=1 Tax=Ditylenchus destructor TaxID=166010 RepID=A0AAD4N612_9BILA|nr:hypothetical protein DdX_06502 [Ditylenchus destructor]